MAKTRQGRKRMHWTTEKVERLSGRYSTADLENLADELGCTVQQLVWKANNIGLKRKKKVQGWQTKQGELIFGNRKRIGKNTFPVTSATRTLICSCALSGYTAEQTATMTERSIEQVEKVLQECKENGWFAMVQRRQKEIFRQREVRNTGRECSGFDEICQSVMRGAR